MSILVVDDSRTQLYLITAILSSGGYSNLLAATSARQAFDHLELDAAGPGDCPVDLIILDLDMPEVDGLEAVRRIKAVERLRDIPIIIITACSDATTLQAAFAAGAMDYITKPPNAIEMLARVHSALRLKQEIDQRKAREASLVNLNQNLEHILTLLDHEREKSERLLLNILPSAVAVRLKDGATDMVVADHFPEASVMFIDVVSFTSFASRVTPTMLVMHLNRLFTYIDGSVKQHGLEKI